MAIFLLICQLETPPFAQQEGIDKSRQTAITYAIEQISNSVVGINVTQLKQQQVNPSISMMQRLKAKREEL